MLNIEVESIRLKEQGNAFYLKENYNEAIDCFNKAIQLNATFKEAWLNKALCHQKLNQQEEALDALTQAIQVDPLYTKAVFNKATLHNSLQQYELAINAIDNYIALGGKEETIIKLRKSSAGNYVKQFVGAGASLNANKLLKLGQQAQKADDLITAKNYYQAAVILQPEHEAGKAALATLAGISTTAEQQSLEDLLKQMQLEKAILEKPERNKEVLPVSSNIAKDNKLYMYVKQGHSCRWGYNEKQPNSLNYGFYAEKFFNCIIVILKSADAKKLVMFHVDYGTNVNEIDAHIQWLGKDCTKIVYLKEHAEAYETLDTIFEANISLKQQFTIKLIKAERSQGKIIYDKDVAPLLDGSLVPKYEHDVIWVNQCGDFVTKYNSTQKTTDDDRLINKTYEQLQPQENQLSANKRRSGAEEVVLIQQKKFNSKDYHPYIISFIQSNDYGNLRSHLDMGLDVNMHLKIGQGSCSLLGLAAAEGKTQLVELLLSRGARVDNCLLFQGKQGGSPLFAAVGRGYVEIVKKLIVAGANPLLASNSGETPFSVAIQNKHEEIISTLLQVVEKSKTTKSESSSSSNVPTQIPFHSKQQTTSSLNASQQLKNAIESGNVDAVQTALAAGANIKALLITGYFPQYITHERGEPANPLSFVSLLHFNQAQPKFGEFPLYFAARLNKLTVVNYLLNHGADVNQTANYGLTPLLEAISQGHLDIALRLLQEPNINVNHAIQDGSTALAIACEKGQEIIVETLLKKGADINQADEEGETPLIVAIIHKKPQLISFLLQSGANPNKNKVNNASPLFFASQDKQLDVIKQLICYGAQIDAERNTDKMTTLMIAAYQGHTSIVFYLLACGANAALKCKNNYTATDYAKNNGHQRLHKKLLNFQNKRSRDLVEYAQTVMQMHQKDCRSALDILNLLIKNFLKLYHELVSLDLATCFRQMAKGYESLGDREQAQKFIKKYYDVYCTLFGEKNRLTLQAKLNYQIFMKNLSEILPAQEQKELSQSTTQPFNSPDSPLQNDYWMDKINIEDTSQNNIPVKTTLLSSQLGQADNKSIIKNFDNLKMIPKSTAGGGDCLFHAIFGSWNDEREQFFCNDVPEKRKYVAKIIRECKSDTALFGLLKEAIQAVIMENKPIKGQFIKNAQLAYKQYQEKNKELILIAWGKFESVLNNNKQIIQYIDDYCIQEKAHLKLTSLKAKFDSCLNSETSHLSGLLLSLPDLDRAYKNYIKECNQNFNWDTIVNDPSIVAEYADFMELLGQSLLHIDAHIIAKAFNITVEFYIKDDHGIPILYDTCNSKQGEQTSVPLCFNGYDHYERMIDNKFYKNADKIDVNTNKEMKDDKIIISNLKSKVAELMKHPETKQVRFLIKRPNETELSIQLDAPKEKIQLDEKDILKYLAELQNVLMNDLTAQNLKKGEDYHFKNENNSYKLIVTSNDVSILNQIGTVLKDAGQNYWNQASLARSQVFFFKPQKIETPIVNTDTSNSFKQDIVAEEAYQIICSMQ